MFVHDFILNGEGHGEVGGALATCRFDPLLLRPYIDNGVRCVTMNTGKMRLNPQTGQFEPEYHQVPISELWLQGINHPVHNTTSLRREEWLQLDQQVLVAARERLSAWTDLASKNSYGGFNAMGKMILEHETMSDPGEALIDMDGLSDSRNDSPLFQLEGLPLPIIHAGFTLSQRRLMNSRNSGIPLDSTLAEASGRRVAEKLERLVLGIDTGPTYGGASTQQGGYGRTSSVYGYMNFPARLTKTDLTTPNGTNPQATLDDVLEMRDQLYAAKFYGPYMLYCSTDWDEFLDNDYAFTNGSNWATNPSMTLRDRLKRIEGIQDVRRLDLLTPANSHAFTMIMVQMTSDVARAVVGMNMITVQWESHGGMRLNFKVMCILVPQLRADYYGNCGILHARTA